MVNLRSNKNTSEDSQQPTNGIPVSQPGAGENLGPTQNRVALSRMIDNKI
jgi:hypothetical protein